MVISRPAHQHEEDPAMARTRVEAESRSVELIEKMVLVQLHALGTPQGTIARVLGKSKKWVNKYLKGVPKPK